MYLIRGTKYASYKIYNKNKDKFYYGVLDIKLNIILFNIEEEIISFMPSFNSNNEILVITEASAYKLCLIKDGNVCINDCTFGDLILDINGNKCQYYCDKGKIILMPEGICINKNDCDLNIFNFNTGETECGLCKYFFPEGNKYKLINSTSCISSITKNSDYYNENLNLLKCKTNYHLKNNA